MGERLKHVPPQVIGYASSLNGIRESVSFTYPLEADFSDNDEANPDVKAFSAKLARTDFNQPCLEVRRLNGGEGGPKEIKVDKEILGALESKGYEFQGARVIIAEKFASGGQGSAAAGIVWEIPGLRDEPVVVSSMKIEKVKGSDKSKKMKELIGLPDVDSRRDWGVVYVLRFSDGENQRNYFAGNINALADEDFEGVEDIGGVPAYGSRRYFIGTDESIREQARSLEAR